MDPQTVEKAIKRCIDISTRLGALEDDVPPRPAASSSSAWTKSTSCSDGSKTASEHADGWPGRRLADSCAIDGGSTRSAHRAVRTLRRGPRGSQGGTDEALDALPDECVAVAVELVAEETPLHHGDEPSPHPVAGKMRMQLRRGPRSRAATPRSERETHTRLEPVLIPTVVIVDHEEQVLPAKGECTEAGNVDSNTEERVGTVIVQSNGASSNA